MDKKDKLDFDLDFLEKDAPAAGSNKPAKKRVNDAPKPSKPMSDTTKKWLIGAGVVGVIMLFGILSDDSSSSSTTNTRSTSFQYNDDLVQTGEYLCSRYHHNRANELEPSDAEGNTLDATTNQLTLEGNRLDSEAYSIENMYVNQYDQWSINQYNNRVDDYNVRLRSYQTRVSNHDRNIDNYNARVQTYNNYLITNCTRAR